MCQTLHLGLVEIWTEIDHDKLFFCLGSAQLFLLDAQVIFSVLCFFDIIYAFVGELSAKKSQQHPFVRQST